MEIVEDREDYCEEEEEDEEKAQMLMSGGSEMGKHNIQTFPFYPSSSSPSPPSSSSSQYKLGAGAAPQGNGRWGGSSSTTTTQSNYDYKQQYQRFSSWNNMGSSGGFEYSRGAEEGAKSTSAAAAAAMGFANNYNYGSAQFDAMDTTTGSSSQLISHGGDHQAAAGDIVHDQEYQGGVGGGPGGGQQQLRGGGTAGCVAVVVEREHMFDKVVTPSDVGKLNRLVIPKQHAEKYFPLDSSANEKGLLLSFEDRSGKPWRFRYSYWNSSQSYVMTKGWSRFVKEKKLDAGDIVSFERGVGEMGKDRLYIDWKRRPDTAGVVSGAPVDSAASFRGLPLPAHHPISSLHRSLPWGRIFFPPPPPTHLPIMAPPPQATATSTHMHHHHHHLNYAAGYNVVNPGGSVFYLRSAGPAVLQQEHRGGGGALGVAAAAGGGGGFGLGEDDSSGGGAALVAPMVFDSVPVVHGKAVAAAKRFRLFGVNLECPTGEEGDNDVLSSSADAHASNTASFLPHHHPDDHDEPPHPHQPSPPLQLRLCGGGPLPTSAQDHLPRKTRPSLSFDFDI